MKYLTRDEALVNYISANYHPRVMGRYWATDIYSMVKGYLTPENFFTKKDIDVKAARNMLSGMAFEAMWKDILEYNRVDFLYGDKIKRVKEIAPGITLVSKPDFEYTNRVVETKFPVKEREKTPEWYLYQLECEYRLTGKEVYLGIFSHPFNIREEKYIPNDDRWELIQNVLIDFHNKLKVDKPK